MTLKTTLKSLLAKLLPTKKPKHPYDAYAKIGKETFPKQSRVGQRVEVSFKNGSGIALGEVVRGDTESPHETFVKLDDGRLLRNPEVFISYNAPAKPKVETMAPADPVVSSDNVGDIDVKAGGDV